MKKLIYATSYTDNSLVIFDVSNPYDIKNIGSAVGDWATKTTPYHCGNMVKLSNGVVMVDNHDTFNGVYSLLTSIKVSDRQNPSVMDSIGSTIMPLKTIEMSKDRVGNFLIGTSYSWAVTGGTTCVLSIDCSSPDNLVLADYFDGNELVYGQFKSVATFHLEDYIYVQTWNNDYLRVFDIDKDNGSLTLLYSILFKHPINGNEHIQQAIVDNDNTVYATCRDTVYVFKIIDGAIKFMSYLGLEDIDGNSAMCYRLVKHGNYVYLSDYNCHAVRVIDASNVRNISQIGYLTGSGSPNYLGNAFDISAYGDYAYVSCEGDNSLTILDISDPTNISYVNNISGAGSPNYLTWTNNSVIHRRLSGGVGVCTRTRQAVR